MIYNFKYWKQIKSWSNQFHYIYIEMLNVNRIVDWTMNMSLNMLLKYVPHLGKVPIRKLSLHQQHDPSLQHLYIWISRSIQQHCVGEYLQINTWSSSSSFILKTLLSSTLRKAVGRLPQGRQPNLGRNFTRFNSTTSGKIAFSQLSTHGYWSEFLVAGCPSTPTSSY